MTPPVAPPPSPGYGAPPPRKKMNWLWWLLGCGCLLAILIIAGAVYGGAKLWKKTVLPELQKQQIPTPTPPATEALKTMTIDEPAKVPSTPAVSQKPGKQAALKAALKATKRGNWVAKVNYASADWQRVKVWVGPPASEFLTSILLQWDSQKNAYRIEKIEDISPDLPVVEKPKRTETIPPKKPAPKPVANQERTVSSSSSSSSSSHMAPPATNRPTENTTPATSGPRPSRTRAIAKCLAQAPESGWVAKATNNSGDWTECTVTIGPSAAESVTQFRLEWIPDKHNYAIRSRQSVGN